MNLHLPYKIVIIDADQKLLRFMKAEYELYDGIPVAEDSSLTLFDILLSIMMNSRLDTADKVKSIWINKKPVEMILDRIPNNISLQNEQIPWDDLEDLFNAFCSIRWAGPAVTTKILYKKRPNLIPIYDSVISMFISHCKIEPPLPKDSSDGAYILWGVKCIRKLLLKSLDQIEQLRL